MSTQVTVRLPDELVAFMDAQVAADQATSRADLVARALEREKRRLLAEHDAAIYAALGADDDLNRLAEWAAAQPIDLD